MKPFASAIAIAATPILLTACSGQAVGDAGNRTITATCVDFVGNVIYQAEVLDYNLNSSQFVDFKKTGQNEWDKIKGTCIVVESHFATEKAAEIASFRATQPLTFTATNGSDTILLSDKFTRVSDYSSTYGYMSAELKGKNGQLLQVVRTNAPNIMATYGTEPIVPAPAPGN
jgi:hypothetical protein